MVKVIKQKAEQIIKTIERDAYICEVCNKEHYSRYGAEKCESQCKCDHKEYEIVSYDEDGAIELNKQCIGCRYILEERDLYIDDELDKLWDIAKEE